MCNSASETAHLLKCLRSWLADVFGVRIVFGGGIVDFVRRLLDH